MAYVGEAAQAIERFQIARAPAYALGGRKAHARRSLTELTRAFPELTIARVRSGLPYRSSYLDRVADGLETLGMRRY